MATSKPFVRFENLNSVIYGNDAKSRKTGDFGKQQMPSFGELSLRVKDHDELEIPEYRKLICDSYCKSGNTQINSCL